MVYSNKTFTILSENEIFKRYLRYTVLYLISFIVCVMTALFFMGYAFFIESTAPEAFIILVGIPVSVSLYLITLLFSIYCKQYSFCNPIQLSKMREAGGDYIQVKQFIESIDQMKRLPTLAEFEETSRIVEYSCQHHHSLVSA